MNRDVDSCAPTDSLNIPARIMWERDCGAVPVVDGKMTPVGIVTDRDICMGAYTQGRSLHTIQVHDVMSKPAVVCDLYDDLVTAEELMRNNKIRRLPVCDADRKLVGIVSLSDIALEAERERRHRAGRLIRSTEVAAILGSVSEPRPHAIRPLPFAPEPGELELPRGRTAKRGTRK